MNTKSIIGVLVVIVVIAGGWWLLASKPHSSSQSVGTAQMQQAGMNMATASATTAPQVTDTRLTGTWVSTTDAKFTRAFTSSGTVTDTYQGEPSADMTGTYSIVDPSQEANFPVPLNAVAGMEVVKIDFGGMSPMYFSINSLATSSLQMTDLSGRGNILSFTKMQ